MPSVADFYTGPDTVAASLMEVMIEASDKYTSLSLKLEAADGNAEAAYELFINSSDDAQAVKLRNAIAQATERLRKLAEEKVVVETLDDTAREKIRVEMNTLKDVIVNSRKTVIDISEMTKKDIDGVKAAVEAVPNPLKKSSGTSTRTGSTLPRVSAILHVTGGNLENEQYPNLASVAKLFDVEVPELQKAFCAAAGVSHENIARAFDDKNLVVFQYQPQVNSAVYTITATPKPRAARGTATIAASEKATEPVVTAPDAA